MADDVEAEIIRLYRRWSGSLVAYTRVYTGRDRDEAAEMVDEAFHLLYLQWDRHAGYTKAQLFIWLRTIARNRAIDDYRKRARTVLVDPVDAVDRLDEVCSEEDSGHPVRALLDGERAELAWDLVDRCMAVIDGMPEHLRLAILLRGEGCSSSEVGTEMGVDASTVRGYWRQAVKTLRAAVGDAIKILDSDLDEQDQNGEGLA